MNERVGDVVLTSPSFEDVTETLSEPLQRYLGRLLGDPTAAEDLLQETLMRIARGLPGFLGQSSLKNWAFSIATRVVADYFRRPDTGLRIVAVEEIEQVPDPSLPSEKRVIIDEMNSCIRDVIDSLPTEYRAALVLHDLEGMTASATAETLGCSLPTAKIRIHRARKRLRNALENDCSFYHDDEDVLRCDRKEPGDSGRAQ